MSTRMTARPHTSTEPVWHETLSAADLSDLQAVPRTIQHTRPDVLVVGGGIIGLCTAYFLAERSLRVQLIERDGLSSGASGASAGGIWPNDQGASQPEAFQPLAFLGRDLWGRLSLRPGFDIDWRVNGFLNVNAERIGPSAIDAASALQERGFAVHAVDGEQIGRLEPQLKGGLAYGLHCPSDAHINPLKAAASLARAARQLGAGVASGIAATAVEVHAGAIRRVETSAGPIEPKHVVCASGWSADWLSGAVAPLPPLRPVSGQLMATAQAPPLLKGSVSGKVLVLQLRTGEIIAGGNLVESNSLVPDSSVSEQFAAAARDLVPALTEVPFVRAWCGVRAGTPDGLPIVDRGERATNLWLTLGHFRNGMLLAPAAGKLLAEWIATGKRPDLLAGFGVGRFTPRE